jgi:hypothetical protein
MVGQRLRRTVHPDGFEVEWAGQKKMPLEKATQIVGYSPLLYKGRSNGTNIRVKLYLNHGPQEPGIYFANIPGVSNMRR